MEYLLMIVVAVTLGYTFQKKMTEYFIKNPNSFINKSLGNYKVLFRGSGNERPYRRFQVVRQR